MPGPRRRRLLTALAITALAGLGGCGGKSDEEQVRDTLRQLETATARGDYETLCNDLLARELVRRLRAVGLPCEVALQTGLGKVRQPRLSVRRIRVDGDRALALVRSTAANQTSSSDTVRLVREDGRWRVESLSGAQPPSPERRLP